MAKNLHISSGVTSFQNGKAFGLIAFTCDTNLLLSLHTFVIISGVINVFTMSAGDEFPFRPKSVFMEEDPNVNDVSPGRKCFLHSGGASGAYKISVEIKIYN